MKVAERKITEWESTLRLHGDEFRRGLHYTNWRPTGSGDYLLIYTVSGGGLITSETGSVVVQSGEIILYDPTARQEYGTDPSAGQWRLVWAHFLPPPHFQEWLRWPQIGSGIRHVSIVDQTSRQLVFAALRTMVRLSRGSGRVPEALAWNAFEEALIRITAATSPDHHAIDLRIQKALDWLETYPGRGVSVDRLARHCGLSPSRFAHLFQQEVGVSPVRFAEMQRLRRAAGLLRRTQLRIGEIAIECGYENGFYFSNRFRKFFGQSPTHYRAACK